MTTPWAQLGQSLAEEPPGGGISLWRSRMSMVYIPWMGLAHRRVTYKIYPNAAQAAWLDRVCELHRLLYNAALDERINASRKAGLSINFQDQCKSMTQIRQENPEYLTLNAQSLQVTLKRLHLALQHFFQRVKIWRNAGLSALQV